MNKSSAERTFGWSKSLYADAAGDMNKVPWALPGVAVPSLTSWLACTSYQSNVLIATYLYSADQVSGKLAQQKPLSRGLVCAPHSD